MTMRRTVVVVGVTAFLVGGGVGAAMANVASGPPGQGLLTQGVSVPGPYSGADASTAGTGTVPKGATRASVTVRLPAYTIPNAGGGQDENHGLAVLQGNHPGIWVTGVNVSPGVSDYTRPNGKLTVFLNRPAPADLTFTYWTFGIFQD